jgi:hypothetical protein
MLRLYQEHCGQNKCDGYEEKVTELKEADRYSMFVIHRASPKHASINQYQ